MAQRIQLRRGTAAEWTAANPVLALGEPGVETDTGKQKFGDGVTAWNSRPYASKGDKGEQGIPGIADDTSVAQQVTNGTATKAALNATYVPKWKPNTAYLAGDKVLSPTGDVVSAKAGFTSGASFNASNWDYSPTYAVKPDNGGKPVGKGELVFNIKDYGNPATDFAGAVNAATAACAAAGGGVVFIPSGAYSYTSSSAITIPSNVALQGAGAGAVTITQNNWNVDGFIRSVGTLGATIAATADVATNSVTITLSSTAGLASGDLLLLGSNEAPVGATTTDGYRGEYIRVRSVDSATQITIWGRTTTAYAAASGAGVKQTNGYNRGIRVSGLRIVNSQPDQHDTGFLWFQNCRDVIVADVVFEGCDSSGIRFYNVFGAAVDNAHILDNPDRVDINPKRFGYGINCASATEQVRITGSSFTRVRHGFTTTGTAGVWGVARNITVSGCTATMTTNAAFDTHPGAVDVIFTGCAVVGNSSYGYQLRGIGNAVIACIADGVAWGAAVTATAFGSKIKDSIFRNIGGWTTVGGTQTENPPSATGGGHGVVIYGATNTTISGNDFENVTRAGIYFDGTGNASITRAYIMNNKFANLGKSGATRVGVFVASNVTSLSELYVIGNLAVAYASATGEPDSTGALDDLVNLQVAAAGVGTVNVLENVVFGLGFNVVGGVGNTSTSILSRGNKVLSAGTYTEQVAGLTVNGALTMADTWGINFGTGTGTKIATSSSQKLAFWGSNPIVRPTGTPAAATDAATTQALVNDLRTKLLAIGLIA